MPIKGESQRPTDPAQIIGDVSHGVMLNQPDLLSTSELANPFPFKVKQASYVRRRTLESRTIYRTVLLISDIVALQLALLLGYLVRTEIVTWIPISLNVDRYIAISLCIFILPIGFYASGLYSALGLRSIERFQRRIQLTTVFFISLIVWDYFISRDHWSRGVLLSAYVFAVVIPMSFETLAESLLMRSKWWGTPAVIFGAGERGRRIVEILDKRPDYGLRPVALYADSARDPALGAGKLPTMGSIADGLALSGDIEVAIVAVSAAEWEQACAHAPQATFRQIIVLSDLEGLQSLWVQARDYGGLIGLEIKQNLFFRHNRILKRAMDYIVAVPALLLAAPLMLVCALATKIVDPGPAFYYQVRTGKNDKPFKVWKLRSMYKDAEKRLDDHLMADAEARADWDLHFKLRSDPRIIPGIGEFIRKTSIDELPQLWNVIRGDMSLIGPRPFPNYHLDQFDGAFRSFRCSVLPGITGLWQISSRSDGDLAEQKMLDTFYIRNWSLWTDIYILFRTPFAVLSMRGAR